MIMTEYPKKVVMEEQGLRDGFQGQQYIVLTEKKVEFVNQLIDAGLKRIQVASFVHPKKVPQMADADVLLKAIGEKPGIILSGLVLNRKGIERAVEAGYKHVAAGISASDTTSRKNAGMSLQEARESFKDMLKFAKENGLRVRGGIQCAFGCRFEGHVDPAVVIDIAKEQLDLGVDEIALADSTGMGNPISIQEITSKVYELAGDVPLMMHIHDTEGKGIANAVAAMAVGVHYFDTAIAGMGGCPFVKGASGNIATDDMVFMLDQMGIETGIDVKKISAISREAEAMFNSSFSGKMHTIITREDIKFI